VTAEKFPHLLHRKHPTDYQVAERNPVQPCLSPAERKMVEELLTISQRLFILDFCYKSCYPEYYTLAQSVKECSIYSISKISVFIILFGFMSGMYGQQVVQDHKIIKMEAFGIPDSRA
jgi:hypothetical protein